jgi:hypothetical protein
MTITMTVAMTVTVTVTMAVTRREPLQPLLEADARQRHFACPVRPLSMRF